MESTPTPRPDAKTRLKALFEAYGSVAIVVYFVLYALMLGGIAFAIRYLGWHPSSAAGTAGLFATAWGVSRVTMIPRLAATVAITPFVAKAVGRKAKPPTT